MNYPIIRWLSITLLLSINTSLATTQSESSPPIDMPAMLLEHIRIDGDLETNHRKRPQIPAIQVNECNPAALALKTTHDGHSIETLLPYISPPNTKKRCEIVINNALRRQRDFSLRFDFKVNDLRNDPDKTPHWFAMMQFHSKPQSGESWRCPVLALESYNGGLRMFNRWDQSMLSTTVNGTCAGEGNSIQSRTLFKDFSYEAERWYKFEISGRLSYTDSDACLTVAIDDQLVSTECGYNTYNDFFHPYLKMGIYKPSTWSHVDDIRVEYRNVHYHQYPK